MFASKIQETSPITRKSGIFSFDLASQYPILVAELHVAAPGLKNLSSIAVGINRDWCISFKRNAPKMSPACHYGREAALYVQASRPKSVARVSIDARS